MASTILTAALPLGTFLDSETFVCTIPEYQRGYQWEPQKHTRKLLADLLHAFSSGQDVALLGNAILRDHGKDGTTSGPWWEGQVRFCDVVDGQQRLTTLVMLYATIHERMQTEAPTLKSQIKQLSNRFGGGNGCSPFLTTQLHHFTSWFNFTAGLSQRLAKAKNSAGRQERENAKFIVAWLQQAAEESQRPVDRFLEQFLAYIDAHVVFTLTITRKTELVFQTFANINYSGKPSKTAHQFAI